MKTPTDGVTQRRKVPEGSVLRWQAEASLVSLTAEMTPRAPSEDCVGSGVVGPLSTSLPLATRCAADCARSWVGQVSKDADARQPW